jgi:prolyl-tRNA synthetase family I
MTDNNQNKILKGITVSKDSNFSEWYRQTIIKSELIDYSDISGCYILRPNAYSIWEKIQEYINKKIHDMGIKNAYFPLFVTKSALETEESHINGFAPEVAWVTKSGTSNLEEPIAIRPTSETIMYPHFAVWIKSHRDLPLKINQWCNVVRWEFKDCTPFIRSREFLWQEGHTCYSSKVDADIEIRQILQMYADVYEKILAVPVILGQKTLREKFAGGDYTTTVECYAPIIGKAVQGATSHSLGKNFSKMFGIQFEDVNKEKQYVYQNSWGITTRTIGVMTMIHGDNKGLVLPPKIAFTKIIIVPCGINSKTSQLEEKNVEDLCQYLSDCLNSNGITTEIDTRDNYRVGYKFNYWELRGIPLRIEVGPKDVIDQTVNVCRRDTGEKSKITYGSQEKNDNNIIISNNFLNAITELLDHMQEDMFNRAKTIRDSNINFCNNITDFETSLKNKQMCLVPWCEIPECEDQIVVHCKTNGITMKSLCIPFDQNLPYKLTKNMSKHDKCFYCQNEFRSYTLFGCSY